MRVGIVGCGRIGCSFDDDAKRGYVSSHAGAYSAIPSTQLVALCDKDEAKLTKYGNKFNVVGRYTDYQEMLAKERLDILSICTWAESHLPIVQAAVQHEVKAIFCEKPIADSLVAADEMIRLCNDKKVLLLIDHQRRFDPMHKEAAMYIQASGIGTVRQATCYYTAGVSNTGTHLFDLLRFFFGDAEWVAGYSSHVSSPNPSDPNIDGFIKFHSGPLVGVQACDSADYALFELHLLGSTGRMSIVSSGFEIREERAWPSPRFSGYKELMPVSSSIKRGQVNFMVDGIRHLLACLERSLPPISSGNDGRAALEIICALIESADQGGKVVSLPLAKSYVVVGAK